MPRGTVSQSLVLELLLTITAWGLTAALLFFTPFASKMEEVYDEVWALRDHPLYYPVLGTGCLFLVVMGLLTWRFGMKRLQGVLTQRLKVTQAGMAFLAYFGLCLCNGSLLYLLAHSFSSFEGSWIVVVGAAGLAWLVGFFAIGIPGGIGVREGALAGVLIFIYGGEVKETAIALAIIWRVAQVIAELLSALSAVFLKGQKTTEPQDITPTL